MNAQELIQIKSFVYFLKTKIKKAYFKKLLDGFVTADTVASSGLSETTTQQLLAAKFKRYKDAFKCQGFCKLILRRSKIWNFKKMLKLNLKNIERFVSKLGGEDKDGKLKE